MRVFLIFIAVIMFYVTVVFSDKRTVKDLTDQCVDGRIIPKYLTTGAGETDFFLGMIASSEEVNCTIRFFVTDAHYVAVFVEFPDTIPGSKVCLPTVNSVSMVSEQFAVEICERLNLIEENSYVNMAPNNIMLSIMSQAELNTVKITATALRNSKNSKCTAKETECLFKAKVFCVTSKTLCDGFANCGVPGAFDEDVKKCQGSRITPIVIISSIIMTVVFFWLIIAVIMAVMPKRRETFVYKFDETMTIFDVEMGRSGFDINVEVLFPDDSEREDVKYRKKSKGGKKNSQKIKETY